MKTVYLLIFSGLSFIILFIVAALSFFSGIWVDFAASVPARSVLEFSDLIPALLWALPFALYLGILLSMNYAFRRKVNGFFAFITVGILYSGFVFGTAAFIDNLRSAPIQPLALHAGRTLGGKGLMLHSADTVFILLEDPALQSAARVVSIPDEPFIYQADGNTGGDTVPLKAPFRRPNNPIFDDIRIDFALSAAFLAERFNGGFAPFASWALSLVLLQVSVSLIFNIGIWPLANLFFGALLLRGILALEVFINSADVQYIINDFLRNSIPDWYISPIIFTCLAVLMLIYVLLVNITRGAQTHV
jgi:hypothetical protein